MHSIRLRHPWQCETAGDVTVWSRKFNWPAELESGESVQLAVEPISAAASITLNGEPLVDNLAGRFDISASVAKHNQLTIACASSPSTSTGKCPFDVRLEVVEEKV